MSSKRKIEVFSAGCAACDETVAIVKRIVCGSCDLEILDMHDPAVAAKAKSYGIHTIPAVVIDGVSDHVNLPPQ
jgi:hypothetical protein